MHCFKLHLLFTFSLLLITVSCNSQNEKQKPAHDSHHSNGSWVISENIMVDKNSNHTSPRMRFKVVNAIYQNEEFVFDAVLEAIEHFSEERYTELSPFILEKNIPFIQEQIQKGIFTYEELTLFYLKRMHFYETNAATSLHSIIALNPNVLKEAKQRDINKNSAKHAIYGMPILLKDNIDTKAMKTTAGAYVLQENQPAKNATIVDNLEAKGALILGKVNLSEWAYYFCSGCPLGYSAIGGQTLNPYGQGQFETGGSSAGSGVAITANYAVAAVGTETAGSIISPSSQNGLVGLKPTPGVLSGTGIIPISHTLDTPGPMAKNVIDAAIVMDALANNNQDYQINSGIATNTRLGVFKPLLEDPLYASSIEKLKKAGATIIEIEPQQLPLDGFLTLLNIEMREGLPKYLSNRSSANILAKNLEDIIAFNKIDSVQRMPYRQELFDGIIADTTSKKDFIAIRENLLKNGTQFFQKPMQAHNLDAIVSINNYHSAYAAVGLHTCLAIPMGLQESGEPKAITLITHPKQEQRLLQLGQFVEAVLQARVAPKNFK